MKTISLSSVVLALGLSLSSSIVTANELIRQDAQNLKDLNDRIVKGQSENSEVRITSHSVPTARNPLRRSSILSCNGKCTIVPAGAIVHIPSRFADRVVSKPQGQLISFPEFLRANYAWVITKEVSGKQDSKASLKEASANSNFLIISTRNQSPISAQISSQ